jgi:ParB-like chromosome segregation protein Spo0J
MEKSRVEHIALKDISLGRYADINVIDLKSINALARNIAANGLERPLEIMRSGEGYVLVEGVKRLRAARLCGFTHLPCVVRGRENPYARMERLERKTAPSAFIRQGSLPVIKDVRLIANTLRNGAEALKKGGLNASFVQTDIENGTVLTLKIVKK